MISTPPSLGEFEQRLPCVAPSRPRSHDLEQAPVALVVIIDAQRDEALDFDPALQAVELDQERLDRMLPAHTNGAVRKVLNTLQNRLGASPRVTAIPVELDWKVRRLLELPSLEFSLLSIDRKRRAVTTAAGLIPLTKGEFDLLVFLAENPNVAFSRPELVDGCRGGDHTLDYRTIDVQIFGLRRKLGPASAHVQTVRGFGYRFVSEPSEQTVVHCHPQ